MLLLLRIPPPVSCSLSAGGLMMPHDSSKSKIRKISAECPLMARRHSCRRNIGSKFGCSWLEDTHSNTYRNTTWVRMVILVVSWAVLGSYSCFHHFYSHIYSLLMLRDNALLFPFQPLLRPLREREREREREGGRERERKRERESARARERERERERGIERGRATTAMTILQWQ